MAEGAEVEGEMEGESEKDEEVGEIRLEGSAGVVTRIGAAIVSGFVAALFSRAPSALVTLVVGCFIWAIS